ncbi:MAG: hypothetical protein IJD74_06655 [Clostridia bacterium]|nr:hypothetical protein [Clostridia bacterium]
MRYNLKKICKKILAFFAVVLFLLVALASDCLAFDEETVELVGEKSSLFMDASLSEEGGCVEVTLGSSRSACGILATLSYDPELLSFLTFAKSDALGEKVTVSCFDSNGTLRILVDADENFEGVLCRFFFSINETKLSEKAEGGLLSEISVLPESAYGKTDSGFSELFFDGATELLDLNGSQDSEQNKVEDFDSVSVQWIDFENAFQTQCSVCVSGFFEKNEVAAGFEITVSCENFTETYTASRILPAEAENDRKYAVIVPLPIRDSFYVTVREIGYFGKNVIVEDKTNCFFICGSSVERVGSD